LALKAVDIDGDCSADSCRQSNKRLQQLDEMKSVDLVDVDAEVTTDDDRTCMSLRQRRQIVVDIALDLQSQHVTKSNQEHGYSQPGG